MIYKQHLPSDFITCTVLKLIPSLPHH